MIEPLLPFSWLETSPQANLHSRDMSSNAGSRVPPLRAILKSVHHVTFIGNFCTFDSSLVMAEWKWLAQGKAKVAP